MMTVAMDRCYICDRRVAIMGKWPPALPWVDLEECGRWEVAGPAAATILGVQECCYCGRMVPSIPLGPADWWGWRAFSQVWNPPQALCGICCFFDSLLYSQAGERAGRQSVGLHKVQSDPGISLLVPCSWRAHLSLSPLARELHMYAATPGIFFQH